MRRITYWRGTTIAQSRFARLLLWFALWWDGVPSVWHDPATELDINDFRQGGSDDR
jgi:hypothetical protein